MSMIKGKEVHTDVNVSHDYQELADEEYILLKDVFLKSNIEQSSLERQRQTLEDQESQWKMSRSATANNEPRTGQPSNRSGLTSPRPELDKGIQIE